MDFYNSPLFFGESPGRLGRSITEEQALAEVAPQQMVPGMVPGQGSPTLPMPPQQPMQRPIQQQQQPGTDLGAFLNSPGMAMASQAMNNMSALRRGQVPRQTPVSALQQAQQQNQVLMNRKAEMQMRQEAADRQAELHPLAVQKAEQNLDPFYEWKEADKLGLNIKADGTKMAYPEWLRAKHRLTGPTSVMQNIELWKQNNPPESFDSPEAYNEALSNATNLAIRAPFQIATGGGGVDLYGLGGRTTAVTPGEAGTNEAASTGLVDKTKQSIATSGEMFTQIGTVSKSIANIDQAITAINKGAETGAIAQFFPSFRAASVELDNIRNNMGLDIVGAGSFGALSESELNFALDTAIPEGLDGPDLVEWLNRKKTAQTKLRAELMEAAIFLQQPGAEISDLIKMKQAKFVSDDGTIKEK